MPETKPKPAGSNVKYVLAGLLLLLGTVGLGLLLRAPAAPPPAPEPPKLAAAERVNPLAQPELILEEAKDAGQPQEAAKVAKPRGPARPARDTWDCQGDVARAALQGVINENRAQIRNCYERRLKVNNVLQGDLKLKLKVGGSGQISATAVAGSLRDNDVFSCVRKIAERWSFPPPSGGDCAVVQVPFQFSPRSN